MFRYNVPERFNQESQRSSTSGHNRNRFSRYRNRDKYQDRHTVERDRHVDRGERFVNEVVPRSRPGSYRPSRAQSMVRERDRNRDVQASRQIPNDAFKYHDNAMTLPASYGRNKNRRNGNTSKLNNKITEHF